MRGGPAETPIYGWSWPPTTKPLGCMIGHAQRPRYVVIVFLYCPTPLSYFPLSRHAHLRCTTFTTPLPLHIHDLTILLCTTSLSCWHGFPVTIVIHHNHQRDPASRYSTFFLPTSYFVQQHLNTIAQPRHRLAVPKTHAEHPPRHTQTFGTLHRHVISREPTAIPESCAAIRLRWQP